MADAQRDGVPQVWADLPFSQRVQIRGEVELKGERWVISTLSFETVDAVGYQYFGDAGVDLRSGELLHLDGDRIVRAIFMPSSPPTWILADEGLLFAGRQGDGGYPSSSIVRFNYWTNEIDMLWLPASYANRGFVGGDVWEFVAPEGLPTVVPALVAAIDAQGNVDPEEIADAVKAVDLAVDGARTYNPEAIPRLALTEAQCEWGDWSGGLLYFIDGVCIFQMTDESGANPTVMVGAESLAGRLVGAGFMGDEGEAWVAIVAGPAPTVTFDRLSFVNVNDPSDRFDTEVAARNEGSTLVKVSLFRGGFVGTWAVDQGSVVAAFDTQAQPLGDFVSPTDRDLGYPPDPFVHQASMSPDGTLLAYIEREWPQDGSFLPGPNAALVVQLLPNGRELQRVEFELETNEQVEWLDFDGKWALVSTARYGPGEPEGPPPVPFVVDIETSLIYPFSVDELGATTFSQTAVAID